MRGTRAKILRKSCDKVWGSRDRKGFYTFYRFIKKTWTRSGVDVSKLADLG